MVIAVEPGLENISDQLVKRGYTIVNYPEYKGVVDAIIYKKNMINHINEYQNSVMVNALENNNNKPSQGVLIINANNKSANQIEEILRSRVYSPLFY
ncbi:MAG TPA: hypothetical protein GX707_15725 [Epulopiscium sp.]|nr:hypothetical protein [Candidatus Epulonipiscium sp.]